MDNATVTAELRADVPESRAGLGWYLVLGVLFGVVLIKSEAVSWFRIQEMFRFRSFHMYGLMLSAVATATVSRWLIARFRITTRHGIAVETAPKLLGNGSRYRNGGVIFGVGWALTGACPGPMFALAGSGVSVYLVTAIFALLGTWSYGFLRPRLPH